MSHVSNIIIQGVFDHFPQLKVVLIGGGITWIPGFLWRLDYWYKANRSEAPSLTALPSEYFARHVRVATYQLERSPGVSKLSSALAGTPWMRESLMYASGYGSPDWEDPADTAARLPVGWAADVLRSNAKGCFRWPSDSPTARTRAM
jgi:predicted TIM-barrel fold metal-dependent hydrolase